MSALGLVRLGDREVPDAGEGLMRISTLTEDLLSERRDLIALVASLDPDEWFAYTTAREWRVLDLVTHLAYFDDDLRLSIGWRSGPGRAPHSSCADVRFAREGVAAEFRTLRPRAALSWLQEAGLVLAASATLADPRVAIPCDGLEAPLWSCLASRTLETWVHCQDIYDALDRRRPWSPRLQHIAMLAVRSTAQRFAPQHLDPPSRCLRMELSGWSYGPESAANRIVGSLEDFCLLATGRRQRETLDLNATGPMAEEWLCLVQAPSEQRGPICIPPATLNPSAFSRGVNASFEGSRQASGD